MSTYNGKKFLQEQINSILNQNGDFSLSLLVRDDGSTDGTTELLEQYSKEGKLSWYSENNLGPAKSFMNLLKRAGCSYDYYAFSDQDDVWSNNKISEALKKLNKITTPAVYCCNAKLVNEKLIPSGKKCNDNRFHPSFIGILTGGGIQGATMVFNHHLAKIIISKPVPNNIKLHDYYVSIVCLAVGGTLIYDRNSYILYRQHNGNVFGLNKGIVNTIKNRIYMIGNCKGIFDIEKTSQHLLTEYGDFLNDKNKKILEQIASYKSNLIKRFRTMLLKGIGNGRFNFSITIRLSILLGKL